MNGSVPILRPSERAVADLLAARPPAHSLPGAMYTDPAVYAQDLAQVWHREWVFAGHECELAETGAYLTLNVGEYSIIVLRGADGVVQHAGGGHRLGDGSVQGSALGGEVVLEFDEHNCGGVRSVSYTHLTLPTNREV